MFFFFFVGLFRIFCSFGGSLGFVPIILISLFSYTSRKGSCRCDFSLFSVARVDHSFSLKQRIDRIMLQSAPLSHSFQAPLSTSSGELYGNDNTIYALYTNARSETKPRRRKNKTKRSKVAMDNGHYQYEIYDACSYYHRYHNIIN